MAITDLTGTTWTINNTFSMPNRTIMTGINFSSDSASYYQIEIYEESEAYMTIVYRSDSYITTIACDYGEWGSQELRTISITGGSDTSDETLIAWLEANAEEIVIPDDVVISYNGSEISSMADSGVKTLMTSGKYCEGNISIEYTKPPADTPIETATIESILNGTYVPT